MKHGAGSTTPPAAFVRHFGGWARLVGALVERGRPRRPGRDRIDAIGIDVIFSLAHWGRLPRDVRAAWLVPEDVQ